MASSRALASLAAGLAPATGPLLAARTGAALDGGEPAAAALTSGFAAAFLVAAGILALGALTAVRTLPARA
jgi:hypothetical protein